MKTGTLVKIQDIGSLATVIQPGRNQIKCELDGEQFWISRDLIEEVKNGNIR